MAVAEPSSSSTGPPRHRVAAVLALIVLTGLTVLQRLDAALSRMQLPGKAAGTASELASPFMLLDPANAVEAAQAWLGWDDSRTLAGAPGWTSAATLRLYAAVDSLVVAVALTALLLVLSRVAASTTKRLVEQEEALAATDVERPADAEARGRRTRQVGALADMVPLAALIYGLADVLENVALLVLATWPSQGAAGALGLLSAVKWIALVTATLLLLLVGLNALLTRRARPRSAASSPNLLDEVVALRAQVLVVGVLVLFVALPGELGQQVDDAVLALDVKRWSGGAIVATVVVTLALCALLWFSGRWCLEAYESTAVPGPGPADSRLLRRLVVTGLVMLVLGGLSTATPMPLVALLVPGALLLTGAVLSLPVRDARPRPWSHLPLPHALLWWLAVAPLLAVGLVSIRSGVLAAVADEPGALWFVAMGVVAVASGAVLALRRRRLPDTTLRTDQRVTVGLTLAAFVGGVVGGALPVQVGGRAGAWAVILLFCMLLLSVIAGLVVLGDRWAARGVLAVVGFRRVPLVAAFVVCVVATSVVDTRWDYHDVRLADPPSGGGALQGVVTIEDALDAWRAQLTKPEAGTEQPLVLVAAAGGGIRAAYWTAGALSCLWEGTDGDTGGAVDPGTLALETTDAEDRCGEPLPDGQRRAFFLASGISGGSVGLAVTRALDDDPTAYPRALGGDFLGSSMAGYVFRDVPNSLFRRLPFDDRAAVMERAWEKAVEKAGGDLACGLLASSYEHPAGTCSPPDAGSRLRFPVLALSSMAIDDGCRLVASPLELGLRSPADGATGRNCRSLDGITDSPLPNAGGDGDLRQLAATRDVLDHSCTDDRLSPSDLPLSAAAHLSARFPYVSPSGRLVSCSDDEDPSHALDGGLLESSGAGALADMWPTIARKVAEWNAQKGTCVVPRLLLLDNGYASLAAREARSRPLEAVAPISGLGAAFGGRSGTARQLASLQVRARWTRSPAPPTSLPSHTSSLLLTRVHRLRSAGRSRRTPSAT